MSQIKFKQFFESAKKVSADIVDQYKAGKKNQLEITIYFIENKYHLYINNNKIDVYKSEKEAKKASDYFIKLNNL
jgi:hypothetical protein